MHVEVGGRAGLKFALAGKGEKTRQRQRISRAGLKPFCTRWCSCSEGEEGKSRVRGSGTVHAGEGKSRVRSCACG